MATYNLGRILPVFQGTYDNSTTYQPMDIVYYNGSSYVAKQTTVGHIPTNTTYWQVVSLSGELSGNLTQEQIDSIVQQVINTGGFVSDVNYNHTDNNFTDGYKDQLDNLTVGDGTLTIKKNGTTVGTFTANQTTNTTLNLSIPTDNTQIGNGMNYLQCPIYADGFEGVEDISVNAGYIYYLGSISYLNIQSLESVETTELSTWKVADSKIYFYAASGSSFVLTYPDVKCIWINMNENEFETDEMYEIIVRGGILQISKLNSDARKVKAITYTGGGDYTISTLEWNTIYYLNSITSLTISAYSTVNTEYEATFYFTADTGWTGLNLPSNNSWIGSSTTLEGDKYVLNIHNNIAVLGKVG